jgi:hypothetical protein
MIISFPPFFTGPVLTGIKIVSVLAMSSYLMNVSKKIFDYYAVEDENIEVGMNNFFNNLMFQFSFFLELGQFDSIRYKSTTVLEYFLV